MSMRLTRRSFLRALGGAALTAGPGCIFAPPRLEELELSPAAQRLVRRCWKGVDPARVVDAHVHIVGLGKGGTGCFVHPDATSLLSPVRYAKTWFYMSASGIHDEERADALFVERLVDLWKHHTPRGRALLLAFDKHYTTKGKVDLANTEFHTPNDYVFQLAAKHPDLFLPASSVHPYRPDALDELRRCKAKGARAIKWLPNAMGIDPLDPRCDPFYELLAKLKLPLISHAGEEQAVHAEEAQELGNPLRLRRPLDKGVTVVVAHCASLGTNRDLDAKPVAGKHPRVSSYDLFRRLMGEVKYIGQLYGEISAMTQFNRCGAPLRETLTSPELHPRLVNGSDYPLPAIDPVIRTTKLVHLDYLDRDEREVINEIFDYNPITFDFVIKRRMKVRERGRTYRLPPSVFESGRVFGL